MGRARTVQPKLFTHEGLFDAEHDTGLPLRLAFAGLFTECDREGRFQWRPRTLKAAILPFDELDFSRVLHALSTRGFIVQYTASNGDELGWIPRFKHHQQINNKEAESELEAPSEDITNQYLAHAIGTREARDEHASVTREARDEHAPTRARALGFAAKSLKPKPKTKQKQQQRERAREGPPGDAPSSTGGGLPAETVSDVLDAGDAGKLAGALRYAGFAATPSNPKVRAAAMHGVSEATLALAIPHAIAEKQAEGTKPSVPFVLAIAERMHTEGLDVPGNVHPMPVRTNGLRYPLTPAQQREAKNERVARELCGYDPATGKHIEGFGFDDDRTVDVPAKEISDADRKLS